MDGDGFAEVIVGAPGASGVKGVAKARLAAGVAQPLELALRDALHGRLENGARHEDAHRVGPPRDPLRGRNGHRPRDRVQHSDGHRLRF
jgi:hypothetical protein